MTVIAGLKNLNRYDKKVVRFLFKLENWEGISYG